MDRAELEAAIHAALDHDLDTRVDTQSMQLVTAPNDTALIVFYDFWEFHMGAESAKVALVDHVGNILRLFPFDNTSTGAGHLATFSADSGIVCIGQPGTVTFWSLPDERFSVVVINFTPSSLTLTPTTLRVREHTYRWGKNGGEYLDGPLGADYRLADLAWHEASEFANLDAVIKATPLTPKGVLDD